MDLKVKYSLKEKDKINGLSIIEEAENYAFDKNHRVLVIMADAG